MLTISARRIFSASILKNNKRFFNEVENDSLKSKTVVIHNDLYSFVSFFLYFLITSRSEVESQQHRVSSSLVFRRLSFCTTYQLTWCMTEASSTAQPVREFATAARTSRKFSLLKMKIFDEILLFVIGVRMDVEL